MNTQPIRKVYISHQKAIHLSHLWSMAKNQGKMVPVTMGGKEAWMGHDGTSYYVNLPVSERVNQLT